MKRRKERELALKILFAHEFNPIPVDDQIKYLNEELKRSLTEFSRELIQLCVKNREKLDKRIETFLINWEFTRVAIIDRILLRMAVVEFLYLHDIPLEVTINEMIEIAKNYSTDKSGQFINGILDAMLKEMLKNNEIEKTGRGLISNLN